MKRAVITSLILASVLCSAAPAADDWKLWNKYKINYSVIPKKLIMHGVFETRFREDVDEFYRYHFYVGPEYYLYKWLSVGAVYGNIQTGLPGDFHTEHRFMYFVTPKFTMKDLGIDGYGLGPLKLSVPNRVDWRIRHHRDHVMTWRYVITPKLSYPVIKTEKFTLSPYVANRWYFDLTDGIGYNQNRIYAGLAFKLYKHVGLDTYYMRLASRSGNGGDWTGSHVIGTGLAFNF